MFENYISSTLAHHPSIDEVPPTRWESASFAIKLLNNIAKLVEAGNADAACSYSTLLSRFLDSKYSDLDAVSRSYVQDCQESLIVAAQGVYLNDPQHFHLGYDDAKTSLTILNEVLERRLFDQYSGKTSH
ncbi:hypothetical protein D6774_02815 [Candidatus Woesearchaeota archaeon]|nr:MAG: hypothetical protein D6774_02815 [Candidatus Woesearchaeota archaeon]